MNWSCVFSSSLVIFLACTQTLFYFSFRQFSKTSASSRAKGAQSAEREKEKYRTSIFFFSHNYLLALAVNKSLKKKIEGL